MFFPHYLVTPLKCDCQLEIYTLSPLASLVQPQIVSHQSNSNQGKTAIIQSRLSVYISQAVLRVVTSDVEILLIDM